MKFQDKSVHTCPIGPEHVGTFAQQPKGYATKRWNGARKEEPYVQCSYCKATFPRKGFEEYLSGGKPRAGLFSRLFK